MPLRMLTGMQSPVLCELLHNGAIGHGIRASATVAAFRVRLDTPLELRVVPEEGLEPSSP